MHKYVFKQINYEITLFCDKKKLCNIYVTFNSKDLNTEVKKNCY